jgi:hypothetical protein
MKNGQTHTGRDIDGIPNGPSSLQQVVEKVSGERKTRQESASKRSVHAST